MALTSTSELSYYSGYQTLGLPNIAPKRSFVNGIYKNRIIVHNTGDRWNCHAAQFRLVVGASLSETHVRIEYKYEDMAGQTNVFSFDLEPFRKFLV